MSANHSYGSPVVRLKSLSTVLLVSETYSVLHRYHNESSESVAVSLHKPARVANSSRTLKLGNTLFVLIINHRHVFDL